jgi:ribosomal protein S27E
LFGGPGDDVLSGGPAAEVLRGGGGHDTLRGRGGPDTLVDGDGDQPDADVLDGGTGIDTVSYARRRTGVSVDLVAGGSSEGDSLSRVESAVGGHGDDHLVVRRSVRCGDGDDLVGNRFRARVLLPHDCERVTLRGGGTALIHPTAVTASAATFTVSCGGCAQVVLVREAGGRHRLLARGTLKPRADAVATKLTPLGRRLAARRKGVWATVRFAGSYPIGQPSPWSFRLTIPA